MTSPDAEPDRQPEQPREPREPREPRSDAESDGRPEVAPDGAVPGGAAVPDGVVADGAAVRDDAAPNDVVPDEDDEPVYADRAFRSGGGIAGGVLLLALAAWLGGDALVRGTGSTPWLALAGLVCAVPLVIAYTLRPAVFANERRLRVRNPFRTITLPWSTVESLRSGYSTEVVADGTKYQLWSIPVSLRARKKASRRAEQAARAEAGGRPSPILTGHTTGPTRAPSDQALDDLRELAERHGDDPRARGEVSVRWAYEVIAPAVAGAVLVLVLLVVG